MAIRKTGAVTGEVTEVEQAPEHSAEHPGIAHTASAGEPRLPWTPADDEALTEENEEADSGHD